MDEFMKAQLIEPWSTQYSNNVEKRILISINFLRYKPKAFIPIVKRNEKAARQHFSKMGDL